MRTLKNAMFLLAGLVACAPEDTADSSDTAYDTGTSTDSSDTADTSNDTLLTWVLDRSVAGAQLSLHPLDISALSSGTPAWFAVSETAWKSTPASGTTVSIADDAPDASLLLDDGTGMRVAAFVAVLGDDPNANTVHDADERFLGASHMLLFWVEGTISADAAAAGVTAGWNAVDYRDVATHAPLDAIPLAVAFAGSRSVTLTGDGGSEPAPTGVVIGPRSGALTTVDSVPWSDPWTTTVMGAPPAGHVSGSPDSPGIRSATEDLFAWTDADSSGDWSSPDATRPICTDASGASGAVRLFWMEGDTNLLVEVLYAGFNGLGWGWNAVVAPSHDVLLALSQDQAASLTLSSTCSWP
jgi:hypothetical protein